MSSAQSLPRTETPKTLTPKNSIYFAVFNEMLQKYYFIGLDEYSTKYKNPQ